MFSVKTHSERGSSCLTIKRRIIDHRLCVRSHVILSHAFYGLNISYARHADIQFACSRRRRDTYTQTHRAKKRAILIPASLRGVLTHTLLSRLWLFNDSCWHSHREKCNGFVFIS